MTASTKIKTPLMSLPVLPTVSDGEAVEFCKFASKLNLSHIVESVNVRETLSGKDPNTGARSKVYVLRVTFWKRQEYAEEYDMSEHQLEQVIERKFVPMLEKAITHDLRKTKSRRLSSEKVADDDEEVGKPQKSFEEGAGTKSSGEAEIEGDEGDGEVAGPSRKVKDADDMDPDDDEEEAERDEEEAEGDGDASATIRNKKQKQMVSYEDDSGDDGNIDEDERGPKSGADFMDLEAKEDGGENDEGAEEVEGEKDENGRTAEERILEKAVYVNKYRFDRDAGRWCELHLKVRLFSQLVQISGQFL